MGGRASRNQLPVGALLDLEDYRFLEGRTWRISLAGYIQAKSLGKAYLLHRLVLGAARGQQIDHIDGNKLDNRKQNLRFCTHQQNALNKDKYKLDATSKYKGVYYYKRVNKWLARIWDKRVLVWSKYFETETAAATERNSKMIELYPEFYRIENVRK